MLFLKYLLILLLLLIYFFRTNNQMLNSSYEYVIKLFPQLLKDPNLDDVIIY